jgi:hypothetical protein
MDIETLAALLAAGGAILGGGGTYAVQRMRNGANGTQPASTDAVTPAQCTERSEAIQSDLRQSREDLMKSIHGLTLTVETGFSDTRSDIRAVKLEAKAEAKDAARAEVEKHEAGRLHNGGS